MENKKRYKYIIVGSGISGCSVAYHLLKYSKDILLLEKEDSIAGGASGAAGAFLSPLLGKDNDFKTLITKALIYSTKFYKTNFNFFIDNCGTVRIPKNKEDEDKFLTYIEYMDFPYTKTDKGYYFKIGSVVNSIGMCKALVRNPTIKKKFNYKVENIKYNGEFWSINNDLIAEKLIITTGINIEILNQSYINIKALWGRRIDITTSSKLDTNFHKECSVSKSFKILDNKYKISIGATHSRDKNGISNIKEQNQLLLKKAQSIIDLNDIEITKEYCGGRACSIDYFPFIGDIIDSTETLKEFPHLKNGTYVNPNRFTRFNNLYILNGVGGRGFVLAPYLANILVEHICNNQNIDNNIKIDRLFIRYVKKNK